MSKKNSLYDMREELRPSGSTNGTHTASMADKDRKRMRRSAYIKMVAMVGIIGAVLAYSSIAWFTQNKENSASGMGVKVGNSPFTLASAGSNSGAVSYQKSNSTYETTLINDMDGAIGAGEGATYTYGNETYYTSGGADTIIWNLTDAYNPKDEGIHPDSSGTFTFYLIPNVDTGFSANVTLHIDGYKATVNKNNEKENTPLAAYDGTFRADDLELIEEDDDEYTAVEYLNRRMLFFGSGTKGSYATFYNEKTISLSYTDEQVTPGVPIPVTVQWIWPKTFAQMACIAEYGNITSDATAVSAIRSYIVAEPDKLLSATKISRSDALDKMADSSTVEGETTYTFSTTKANDNVIALSEGYNVADNTVGKDVQYFLLTITVE